MQLPRFHRLRQQLYRMEASCCEKCGRTYFPPRLICPECRSRNMKTARLSGRGKVYSFTTVSQPPRGHGQMVPYAAALVELEEGFLVAAQLSDVDPSDVSIGMAVEMVTRKILEQGDQGLLVYGYKFRPILQEP